MLFDQSTARLLKVLFITSSISLTGCLDKDDTEPETEESATIEFKKITGLKGPESLVQAKDGKIYVSEINEFGKNRDGQISVIENG